MRMSKFEIISPTDSTLALIAKQIQGCETLEDVRLSLAFESSPFAACFIYKGGHHVSLHFNEGEKRFAVVIER